MKKKILIILPITILLIVGIIILINTNDNSILEKQLKTKLNKVTKSKNDDYVEETIIQSEDSSLIENNLKTNKIDDTKSNNKSNDVNVNSTTTKPVTTQSQPQITTTIPVTTTSKQCVEKNFSSPFFRGDFKNDENSCHSTGENIVARTNSRHIYECEYEFDDCGIKWWMLIMYDENDKSYDYHYFNSLYPQY